MDLAALIAPLTEEAFFADYFGKKPLHVPAQASSSRSGLLSWRRLNDLLAIRSHWTEETLKLIINSSPVAPEFYIDEVAMPQGPVRRASAAKVDMFLGMGASLVADFIHLVSPELEAVTDMLGDRFSGRSSANAYCSFRDVQAFASHCDLHEVFAVHCEGEKRWRIYENRALDPIEPLQGEDARQIIDQAKGRVMMEVTMRSGDLLYIPRGFYHDALASSEASLHVTFSVAPHSGRILFRLLERMAILRPEFRAYLPDAREEDGTLLHRKLMELGDAIVAMLRTPQFQIELAKSQRSLWEPAHSFALPRTPVLEAYARVNRPARIIEGESGPVLQISAGEVPLGIVADAAEWLLGRPAFSVQELLARFPTLPRQALRQLVTTLVQAGLFASYAPRP